jgi:uncharacterized protein with HEPN domain
MRPRDPSVPIEDAVRAGEAILKYLGTSSLQDYASDEVLASAVERQFEITGEALARAVRAAPGLVAAIPAVLDAIGFRNVLAHGYDVVAGETVFSNARNDLPALLERLRDLLGSQEVS